MSNENLMQIPSGYENYLSKFKECFYDSYCGEPIKWGFKIIQRMDEKKFNTLRNFGSLECSYPNWYLITKTLTRKEAIEKYGEITEEERGPKGGFRSITFGKTKFFCKDISK